MISGTNLANFRDFDNRFNNFIGKTLIIIPAYNEAPNLSRLITEIKKFIPSINYLIIDDASIDSTKTICQAKNFNCLSHSENKGVIKTVFSGYEEAKRLNYNYVVRIDGDGQHPPNYIPKLLIKLFQGQADLIIGSRFYKQTSYKASFLRFLAIKHISSLINLFMKHKIKDPTSGFWAMNAKTYRFLVENKINHFYEPTQLFLLEKKGFKIEEVSVEMRQRQYGQSHIHFLEGLKIASQITFQTICLQLKYFLKNSVGRFLNARKEN